MAELGILDAEFGTETLSTVTAFKEITSFVEEELKRTGGVMSARADYFDK